MAEENSGEFPVSFRIDFGQPLDALGGETVAAILEFYLDCAAEDLGAELATHSSKVRGGVVVATGSVRWTRTPRISPRGELMLRSPVKAAGGDDELDADAAAVSAELAAQG